MADFTVEVTRVLEVSDHPNADRLSIVKVMGYICIAGKLEDGSHRYKRGDLVVYIPESAVVPEWWLKKNGFWDDGKNRGLLDGANKNRVKAKRLRGVFSQGILQPVIINSANLPVIAGDNDEYLYANEGEDVAEFLDITKFEPKIPQNMAGIHGALYNVTLKYDFESIQKRPKLFDNDEEVIVTEKIHGTNIQIGVVPGLHPAEEDVYVTSKGLGAKGFNILNNEDNDDNLYVKELRKLIDNGTIEKIKMVSMLLGNGVPIRMFGEVFGSNIQDLNYGKSEPTLMLFDVMWGDRYLPHDEFETFCKMFELPMVPVLYRGPFDAATIEGFRDGMDTITGTNIREGVVIKGKLATDNGSNGRKIAKWVSPDYLLRKGDVTEFS